MKTKSNPKSAEDYLKMFSVLIKLRQDLIAYHYKALETYKELEGEDVSITETSQHAFRAWSDFNELQRLEGYIQRVMRIFPKENQVLSLLKFIRAFICYSLKVELKDYLSDMRDEEEIYNQVLIISGHVEIPDRFKNESDDVYHGWIAKCIKEYNYGIIEIVQSYMSKMEKIYKEYSQAHSPTGDVLSRAFNDAESAVDRYIQNRIEELEHYIDFWKRNKVNYRPIIEYSWDGKTPLQIIHDLTGIEEKLIQKYAVDEEYDGYLEEASKTELFFKINENLAWYLIHANSCDFESYIGSRSSKNDDNHLDLETESGSHCGADSDADVLFSLRSIDSNGKFIHRATVSAKILKSEVTGEVYYALMQMRGRKNNPIYYKLWPYMYEFYMHPKIILELEFNGYKYQTNFSILWLNQQTSKAMYQTRFDESKIFKTSLSDEQWKKFKSLFQNLMKKKPYILDEVAAISKFKIFDIEARLNHVIKGARGLTEVISDEESIYVHFDDLSNLMKFIGDHANHKADMAMGELLKHWEGEYDHTDNLTISLKDEDYWINRNSSEIEAIIKKHFPHVHTLMNMHQVFEKFSKFITSSDYPDELELIREAIKTALVSALYSGYEAGTSSAASRAVENFLDEHKLEYVENDETIGSIEYKKETVEINGKSYPVKKWYIELFQSSLVKMMVLDQEWGSVFIGNNFTNNRSEIDLNWEYELDEEAFLERFEDELNLSEFEEE